MKSARSQTLRMIVNVVAFQLGWFACVLAAARGRDMAGVSAASVIVAAHVAMPARRGGEFRLIAAAVVIGALWDSLLRGTGLMVYQSPGPAWLAPGWILAMWALFGTTLNFSLRWLRGRTLIAVLFGAVGGPLAFWAGERLGAVQITGPWAGLLAQAAGWAVILPLLMHLAQRFDRSDLRTPGEAADV
jgi:hypothetical protein